jgi:hypothetical protein
MTPFEFGRRNELLAFITFFTNEWLDVRMNRHQYNKDMLEQETAQFLNLPLRTVFALVQQGLLTELPKEHPGFVSAFTVERLLSAGVSYSLSDAVEMAATHQPVVVEIISEKTNLQHWLRQKEQETKVSTRLINILTGNTYGLNYLEDVTKQEFFMLRNAGPLTWAEFVKLRGW